MLMNNASKLFINYELQNSTEYLYMQHKLNNNGLFLVTKKIPLLYRFNLNEVTYNDYILLTSSNIKATHVCVHT